MLQDTNLSDYIQHLSDHLPVNEFTSTNNPAHNETLLRQHFYKFMDTHPHLQLIYNKRLQVIKRKKALQKELHQLEDLEKLQTGFLREEFFEDEEKREAKELTKLKEQRVHDEKLKREQMLKAEKLQREKIIQESRKRQSWGKEEEDHKEKLLQYVMEHFFAKDLEEEDEEDERGLDDVSTKTQQSYESPNIPNQKLLEDGFKEYLKNLLKPLTSREFEDARHKESLDLQRGQAIGQSEDEIDNQLEQKMEEIETKQKEEMDQLERQKMEIGLEREKEEMELEKKREEQLELKRLHMETLKKIGEKLGKLEEELEDRAYEVKLRWNKERQEIILDASSRTLFEFEEKLIQVQIELDSVSSNGDELVQKKRKGLNRMVQSKLATIDLMKVNVEK